MAHVGHNIFYIRCHRTHRVVEIRDFSVANGAKIQMHDKTGNFNQLWQFNSDGTIENPQTGKVLESEGSHDGAHVVLNSKKHVGDNANQIWEFHSEGHHWGYIRNPKTHKVFDIKDWNESDRAIVQIHHSHDVNDHSSWNQMFELELNRDTIAQKK